MRKLIQFFLCLFIFITPSFADEVSALEYQLPTYIDYELKLFGVPLATTRLLLQVDDAGNYVYQIISKPAGITKLFRKYTVVERSQGKIVGNRLVPEQWSFVFDEGKNPPTQKLDFDWDSRVASGIYKGVAVAFGFPKNIIDRAITQPALVVALQAGMEKITFVVADKHRVKKYEYQRGAHQTLKTKIGKLDTIQVKRIQNGKPHRTTLWCAPEYGYIPVKAKHYESGLSYVLNITGVSKEMITLSTGG